MQDGVFRLAVAGLVVGAVAGTSTMALADSGTLVASGDEWQLSNTAYGAAYVDGTTAFVNDLAITFGGSNYLFLTGNGTIAQSNLGMAAAQFESLGKTVSYSATFDPVAAASYDAVFHFGQYLDTSLIGDYVLGGGNAYVSLGSGFFGSAAGEAAAWNPVLNQFGLVAGSTWFWDRGFVLADISVGPWDSLIWGYGQSIEKLTPDASSQSYVRGSYRGSAEVGLVGSSRVLGVDPNAPAPGIPEPASWALLIAGFGLVGMTARRRKALAAS